jgi:hypothetical protein
VPLYIALCSLLKLRAVPGAGHHAKYFWIHCSKLIAYLSSQMCHHYKSPCAKETRATFQRVHCTTSRSAKSTVWQALSPFSACSSLFIEVFRRAKRGSKCQFCATHSRTIRHHQYMKYQLCAICLYGDTVNGFTESALLYIPRPISRWSVWCGKWRRGQNVFDWGREIILKVSIFFPLVCWQRRVLCADAPAKATVGTQPCVSTSSYHSGLGG